MKTVIIIGAGAAGQMIVHELLHNTKKKNKYSVAGYLDDNAALTGQFFEGIPVLGKISEAANIVQKYNADTIYVAIPSASSVQIRQIIESLYTVKAKIKIVPGMIEIIEGSVTSSQLRPIEPSDLLGREEVTFDIEKLSSYYKDKTVFITGAGGSIGAELLQQILCLPVRKIVAFGHGENSIHTLLQTVGGDSRFEYVIGDVKDQDKIMCEVQRFKPDIIFHAAAHKHVPLMEEYPDEAIKNNIVGTYNCCMAAIEGNVKKFVLISTDKAVKPSSVMGASKRIAEQIVLSMNNKKTKTHFILTRFGNVLGSRGSVVPVFQRQIQAGGPVTVTHPEMTRFFMSIREAARLVIKAASLKYGNIFILDMGQPVKIIDLAKSMILLSGHTIDEIPIKISGIRPGEKLTEEILTDTEKLAKTEFEKLFISEEKSVFYEADELPLLIEDFLVVAQTYDKTSIRNFIMSQVK